MATSIVTVSLFFDEPEQMDELCPTCLNPSMLQVNAFAITMAGISHVATATFCNDCGPTRA